MSKAILLSLLLRSFDKNYFKTLNLHETVVFLFHNALADHC